METRWMSKKVTQVQTTSLNSTTTKKYSNISCSESTYKNSPGQDKFRFFYINMKRSMKHHDKVKYFAVQ